MKYLFGFWSTSCLVFCAAKWGVLFILSARNDRLLRILFRHDFYSERIKILWCEFVRERHIDKVILRFCLITCRYLIYACAFFIGHKFGKGALPLLIGFQIYFLIFFVFRHWKSILYWFSLIDHYITQLILEVWLTIDYFNFKREGSLLIQWIGDVPWNFKLAKMSYGLELIDIIWKGTERRLFCVLYSHR